MRWKVGDKFRLKSNSLMESQHFSWYNIKLILTVGSINKDSNLVVAEENGCYYCFKYMIPWEEKPHRKCLAEIL